MKMSFVLSVFLAGLVPQLSFAFDWSSASGAVVVPAGEAYVATESDMASVNALTTITVSGADGEAAAGVLEFRNCSTIPKSGLLQGAGVVRKTGDEEWNFAVDNSGFDGDFRICGGRVITTTSGAFGNTSSGTKGALYVEDGASLKIASTAVKFCYRAVHIAGGGFGTAAADKALNVDTAGYGAIALLYLDADATVYVRSNGNYYWMGNQGRPFGNKNDGSQIWTEGHTLTKTGAMDWYFLGLTINGAGRIVNGDGNVFLRESSLGPADAEPFELAASAAFGFFNAVAPVLRPLQLDAPVTFYYAHNKDGESAYRSTFPLLTTNKCSWLGPVVLNGADSVLNVKPNDWSYVRDELANDIQLSFLGGISGAGSVTVGGSDQSGKGRVVLGGHSSYAGATTLYGGDSLRIFARWHDSIPDFSKTTVSRGYVAAVPGTETDAATGAAAERWTKEQLFAFHNAATFLDGGALAIDASECDGGVFELTAQEMLAGDRRPEIGWGAAGGTVRISSEAGDELEICPNASRGTLELTGGGTFVPVGTNVIAGVSGDATNTSAKVVVTGGATVLQGARPVFLGRPYFYSSASAATKPKSPGTLVVKGGAKWLTSLANPGQSQSQEGLLENAIYVGSHAAGVLDVQDGGFVSNKVVVGGGQYQATHAAGSGAVYVGAGGRLFVTAGSPYAHVGSMLGMGGTGYLQIDEGGSVEAEAGFAVGGYGTGVLHQYGGTYRHLGSMYAPRLNRGNGVIYVRNGTAKVDGNMYLACGSVTTVISDGCLTVDGEGARFEIAKAGDSWNSMLYFCNGRESSNPNRAYVNMNNGGTLSLCWFCPYERASEKSVYVNFNGGTLDKCVSGGSLVYQFPSRIQMSVYEKGATIDCAYDTRIDAAVPLAGRVAGGVQAIDAGAATNGFWAGAPFVTVSGAGEGATAVADWDPAARRLKGVTVTSRGWGYAQGGVTVTLKTAQRTETLTGDAVTVGDNDIGGFTLKGSATLTLAATNSWQKWTEVAGTATLKAASDGAIPSGTELRLNGGTLDLGGFDEDAESPTTFAGLSGTGGTVVNGAVRLAGETWEISAKKFAARESTALVGTLDLSNVKTVRLVDADALDEAAKALGALRLVSATKVVWPESLAIEGAPRGWHVARTANGLRLGPDRGMVLIVR